MLLGSCSKPYADFVIKEDNFQLPAAIDFQNTSKNATTYTWWVNDEQVSSARELAHCFLESGKHQVRLDAESNGKIATRTKELVVAAPTNCVVHLETTMGNLIMELSEETPIHLRNFTKLVEEGFYNGLIFHRVIDGFMIQGGDNKSRNSGKRLPEPPEIKNEISNDLIHVRGAVAAARMPDDMNPKKKSSGSQFYIVEGRALDMQKLKRIREEKLFEYKDEQIEQYLEYGGTPQLDGEYTVFGRLLIGYDVMEKISSVDTDKYDKPEKDVRILKARMLN